MDRSLKWRSLMLLLVVAISVCILMPTLAGVNSLPTWYNKIFRHSINLGTDLKGGSHTVYSIDLDKAVADRAGEIRRELETKFGDDKIAAEVRTPSMPVGAVTVLPKDPAKKDELTALVKSDHSDTEPMACPAGSNASLICVRVSSKYADGIKTAALRNAVLTIRERIDEKGIAEPTVVEKGDEIIVEFPGLSDDLTQRVKDIIARTAKLEFKVVDNGTKYMSDLYAHVLQDPAAAALNIKGEQDRWRTDGGAQQSDFFLTAPSVTEDVTVAEAKQLKSCWNGKNEITDGKVSCKLDGQYVISRYVAQLAAQNPSFKIQDDHELGFEIMDNNTKKGDELLTRSYYMESSVRLTGSAVANAVPTYDQTTNHPMVALTFNRYGGRVFGDLTAKIVGKKFAIILDGKVKSAPTVNGAIRGGNASITMGGGDAQVQEKEAQDLVAVLKTGSLPAPLKEESSSKVGASLGRDAIEKTKFSFAMGILLVVIIMVGIYRFSGVISIIAVGLNILLMMTAMVLFGATLTLPGIAALVLTVGMAVDANILIYERIRDELLLGKSVRGAVDIGFSRAFTAILDGHVTTAAGGVVLYFYGSGPIKGFAVMLLVGICTTLFTNVWGSRVLFDWYMVKKANAPTISI
jgi:preprotein translocase subunit SecD